MLINTILISNYFALCKQMLFKGKTDKKIISPHLRTNELVKNSVSNFRTSKTRSVPSWLLNLPSMQLKKITDIKTDNTYQESSNTRVYENTFLNNNKEQVLRKMNNISWSPQVLFCLFPNTKLVKQVPQEQSRKNDTG